MADRDLQRMFNHLALETSDDPVANSILTQDPIGQVEDDFDEDAGVECVVFHHSELAAQALPLMDDLRRSGKLCDVTIKVRAKLAKASLLRLPTF